PVEDGTAVAFTTDHGILSSATAMTTSGAASVTLTSELSTETIVATVTAAANDASDVAAVFFIPEGGAGVVECSSVCLSGCGTCDKPVGGIGCVTIDAGANTTHTISTARYDDNPGDTPTFQALGDYYDVHLNNVTDVNSLTIDFCPTEPDTVIYYWDGADWSPATDQSYADGCVVVTVTKETFPSLLDLTGLPFASGIPYPVGAGGGAAAGAPTRYLRVDFLGEISRMRLDDDNRLRDTLTAPSPDGRDSLEIKEGTRVPIVDEEWVYLIEIKEAEECPPLPEDAIVA
ncbi:unnamed protein product, partial [marine sediment metagenome]